MKIRYLLMVFLAAALCLGTWFYYRYAIRPLVSPLGSGSSKEKPLLAYTFTSLKKTAFRKSPITLGGVVAETADTRQQLFSFSVPAKPGEQPSLKVSGVINMPVKGGTYPVIVMLRGFIPEESYAPGAGTQHAAEVFAQKGYVTVAPDFLGFGQSDKPSGDGFEARFQTYTTAITLINSLANLNDGLDASYSGVLRIDPGRIGLWGHSNGGHIALSVLAITGASFPTVLWAPVSKSFPYSILYYTDEADDQGKALRKAVAGFEEDYNADLFSPPSYYPWIKAPLALMQGTADREVPVWWSDDLAADLKKLDIDLAYSTFAGADHNLLPSGWTPAVLGSVSFYDGKLK